MIDRFGDAAGGFCPTRARGIPAEQWFVVCGIPPTSVAGVTGVLVYSSCMPCTASSILRQADNGHQICSSFFVDSGVLGLEEGS